MENSKDEVLLEDCSTKPKKKQNLREWIEGMSSADLLKLEGLIIERMCKRFNEEAKKEGTDFELHIDL